MSQVYKVSCWRGLAASLASLLVCISVVGCSSENGPAPADTKLADKNLADKDLSDDQLLLELQDTQGIPYAGARLVEEGDGNDWAEASRRQQLEACLLFVQILCAKETPETQRGLSAAYRHDIEEIYAEFGDRAREAKVGQLLYFVHGYSSDARAATVLEETT